MNQKNSRMGTGADRKTTRLRASCDACNESKVRCSQAKPTCARCEKQAITCIYGLSRRTHKNAPRVGAQLTPNTMTATATTSLPDISTSTGNYDTPLPSLGSLLPSPSPGLDDSATCATSIMSGGMYQADHHRGLSDSLPLSPPPPGMYLGEQQDHQSLLESVNLSLDFRHGPDPLSEEQLRSYNFLDHCLGTNPISTGQLVAGKDEIGGSQQDEADDSSSSRSCRCESHLMKQIGAMLLVFEDQGITSFDIRLSKLQQAVKVVEACMQCACTLHDELAILMISTLVGRVIQGFEKALPRAGLDESTNMHVNDTVLREEGGNGQGDSRKLSWGMLQIEPDEENKLKRHMWLLQFRKLRRTLSQFSEFVGQLRGTDSQEDVAQIVAYQFIYKWLDQKVENVTSQYQILEGDE